MSFRLLAVICLSFFSTFSLASKSINYKVTITNITRGQTFTPQLLVTHNAKVQLFQLGQPAGDNLELLAEAGATQPFTDYLLGLGNRVGEVKTIGGLLAPGDSVSTRITAGHRQGFISMGAMLIPTNDTFVGANRVRLPRQGERSVFLRAYDAGTELNDQNCANMPGPRCGGEDFSAGPNDTDEGYVYVGNGFHSLGDVDGEGNEILGPLVYDWNNPVAIMTIKRIY